MPFHADLFGEPIDYIWNIASESHVDRSLTNPTAFIRNNVELIMNVLEFAREVQPKIFLHMSTDEVFGPQYDGDRSEEHTSELQSLMRISYAVFCLQKKQHHHEDCIAHIHTSTRPRAHKS